MINEHAMHGYSCVVLSQEAKLLRISYLTLLVRLPSYCIEGIKQVYFDKQTYRNKLLENIVKQQELNFEE